MDSGELAQNPKAPEDWPMSVGAVMVIFGLVILGLYATGWGFRGLTWLFGWDLQTTIGVGLLSFGLLIVAVRAAQGIPLSRILREDLRPENRHRSRPSATERAHHDALRLASNLDEMGLLLGPAHGHVAGIDLRSWAASIRDGDARGVEGFLGAKDALARLESPQGEGDRFGSLLAESVWLARRLERQHPSEGGTNG